MFLKKRCCAPSVTWTKDWKTWNNVPGLANTRGGWGEHPLPAIGIQSCNHGPKPQPLQPSVSRHSQNSIPLENRETLSHLANLCHSPNSHLRDLDKDIHPPALAATPTHALPNLVLSVGPLSKQPVIELYKASINTVGQNVRLISELQGLLLSTVLVKPILQPLINRSPSVLDKQCILYPIAGSHISIRWINYLLGARSAIRVNKLTSKYL